MTCSGTQTGAQLSYDNEGQLAHWQSSPSSPGSTDDFLYDGEGNRIEQQSVSGTTTMTMVYVGGLEQDTTTQTANTSSTTRTQFYYANGQRIAVSTNGTLFSLASDGLGSTQLALDGTGTPMGSQLFAPYGTTRYQSGTLPLDYGFTGQHSDSVTGLSYYNARYYDPLAGQFASADSVLAGLNRYAYVGGNPETYSDPSGCFGIIPWYPWSGLSVPQPVVIDPILQRHVDSLYGHGGVIGPNRSSMDALRFEANTGQPVGGKWHYIKVSGHARGLGNWLKDNASTADPADVAAAKAMELDGIDAILQAESSQYSASIPGTPANLASQSSAANVASGGPPSSTASSGVTPGTSAATGTGGPSGPGPAGNPASDAAGNSGQAEWGQTLEQRDAAFGGTEPDNLELALVEGKRGFSGEFSGQSYDPLLDGPLASEPPSSPDAGATGGNSWGEEFFQEFEQTNTPGSSDDPVWLQFLKDAADDGE